MEYRKPTILSTLQSYGPEYQQFRDAVKQATTEELELALKSIYQITRRKKIQAELNRRAKVKEVEIETVERIVVRLHDLKETATNIKNRLLDKFNQTSNINSFRASMDVELEIATYDIILDEIKKILDGAK